ncbi:MAG: DMT family transporter [Parachlamydiales bacterium]|nr:DMT family transporter [Parachlamydiales bacterium]
MDLNNRPERQTAKGISFFILASLFMALMGAAAKELSTHQTVEATIFWRNFIGLLLLFPWLLIQKEPLKKQLHTKQIKMHCIRGVTNYLTIFLYFLSLSYLPLSNATLLFNTIPIFIPIIAYFWQGIVIHKQLWWGLGVAFLGILIALDPRAGFFQPASILALLSGVTGAITLVSLRLGHYSETSPRLMFYLFSINMLLAFFCSLFSFQKSWMALTGNDIFWLVLVGIYGFFYQVASTFGAKFVPMRLGAVFIFFSVIFSFLFDHWIWKTELPLSVYLGCALIIIGAILKVVFYPKDDIQLRN